MSEPPARLKQGSTELDAASAVVTAVAVPVATLLAALLGGKVGHRSHHRVDRAARGH